MEKARQELRNLRSRRKGVTMASEKTSQLTDKIGATENEIVRALSLELQNLQTQENSFLYEALEVEKNHAHKLEEELIEIKKSYQLVSSFRERTIEISKLEEENIKQVDRINLLKSELKELQNKL